MSKKEHMSWSQINSFLSGRVDNQQYIIKNLIEYLKGSYKQTDTMLKGSFIHKVLELSTLKKVNEIDKYYYFYQDNEIELIEAIKQDKKIIEMTEEDSLAISENLTPRATKIYKSYMPTGLSKDEYLILLNTDDKSLLESLKDDIKDKECIDLELAIKFTEATNRLIENTPYIFDNIKDTELNFIETLKFNDDEYLIKGTIDAVVEIDGKICILDYKIGSYDVFEKRIIKGLKYSNLDLQLGLYAIYLEQVKDVKVDCLAFLGFDTEKDIETLVLLEFDYDRYLSYLQPILNDLSIVKEYIHTNNLLESSKTMVYDKIDLNPIKRSINVDMLNIWTKREYE